MKHTAKVTLILLVIFFCAQMIGLAITNQYIDAEASLESGKTEFRNVEISGITLERPDVNETYSFVYITIAILIGTFLILLLIKFKKNLIWKAWYFIAVLMCLSISFAAWRSKHMIKLAKFQAKSNMFAGLFIPYKKGKVVSLRKKGSKKGKSKTQKVQTQVAVLGGGDIGFPLLCAGVILKTFGLGYALIIPPIATLSLAGLFLYSRKGKFYPAMPVLSAGCFVGIGIVYLLRYFL